MGIEPGDFQGEPKKVFVNKLMKEMYMIELKIYYESRYLGAIEPLQGLINSLRKDSKKDLAKEYEELESFEMNTNLCTPTKIKKIHNVLNSYLHEHYLKDSYFAKPLNPDPKRIG